MVSQKGAFTATAGVSLISQFLILRLKSEHYNTLNPCAEFDAESSLLMSIGFAPRRLGLPFPSRRLGGDPSSQESSGSFSSFVSFAGLEPPED